MKDATSTIRSTNARTRRPITRDRAGPSPQTQGAPACPGVAPVQPGSTHRADRASYTGRSRISIGRDFDRWEQRGFEGLADEGAAPGNPPRITQEARTFLKEKLSNEKRAWNATQLAEALKERFGVGVGPD